LARSRQPAWCPHRCAGAGGSVRGDRGMKLMRLLGLPWMALSQRWRMGIGVCFALLFVGATTVGVIRLHDTNGVLRTVHAVAGADCLFWAGVLSQSLLLAREAHR